MSKAPDFLGTGWSFPPAIFSGGQSADGAGRGERDTELGETPRFAADGERHRLWIQHNGREATVMLASTPTPLANQLSQWRTRLNDLGGQFDENSEQRRPQAERLLNEADTLLGTADTMSDALIGEWQDYMRGRASGNRPPDDNQLEAKEQQLVVVLRQLFELFGESAETGANINSRIVHRTRNLLGLLWCFCP
ncbi:MAG: hypothetical protein P8Y42_21835 [Exilibacterium sp.]